MNSSLKKKFFDQIKTKTNPYYELNEDGCKMIENISALMPTDEEIARALETTVDTLTNVHNKEKFSEAKKKGEIKQEDYHLEECNSN